MASLFISYSRKDIDIAKKLTESFKGQGLDFWIDWEGIPPTVDWWKEIEKGIEEADIFLFLISPDSAKSKFCRREIEHAAKNGKRLIPIVVRDTQAEESPSELSTLNWIFFRENDDFNNSLEKLIRAIKTDYEWVQIHRQLQVKALEWERNNHENSFLLRGKELQDAEIQLATNSSKQPNPTDLQREYVLRSRQAADRQRKTITSISVGALIALAALAVFGFVQAGRAIKNANEAQARTNELNNLAIVAQANKSLTEQNPDLATALALQATLGGNPIEKAYATLLDAAYIDLSRDVYSICEQINDASAWVTALDISPDNKTVAIGCSNNNTSDIYILQLPAGDIQAQWHYSAWLHDLAFSPDGQSILTGYSDGKAIIWSLEGKSIFNLEGHNAAISAVDFNPNGTLAVTGSYDKTVILWDVTTGKVLQQIKGSTQADFPGKLTSVGFSPKTEKVVLGDDKGNVFVWDYENHLLYYPESSQRHSSFVLNVRYSPDGSKIISSSADSTIAIWDLGASLNQESLLDFSKFFPGVWVKKVEYLPDNTKILAALSNGLILLVDVRSLQVIQTLQGHLAEVESLAVSSDGALGISGARDGTVRLWDLQVFSAKFSISNNTLASNSFVITSDGSKLIGGSADGYVHIWDSKSGNSVDGWQAFPKTVSISEVSLSPDENLLLTVGNNGSAILWDIRTHILIRQFPKGGDNARSVDISSDGDHAIIGYASGEIVILGIKTDKSCTLNGHTNAVNSVRFSPDGETAASGSNDYKVVLWDVSTCKMKRVLYQHDGWVMALEFSPDEKLIASASADSTIILWDLDTQQQVYRLRLPEIEMNPGLDGYALSLDFSADGLLLSSGFADGNVAIWSVINGTLLRKYIAPPIETCQYGVHCFWVLNTKFAPQGDNLWVSTADGWIRVWQLIPVSNFQELQEWLAKNRYTRELTEKEKAAYEIGQ